MVSMFAWHCVASLYLRSSPESRSEPAVPPMRYALDTDETQILLEDIPEEFVESPSRVVETGSMPAAHRPATEVPGAATKPSAEPCRTEIPAELLENPSAEPRTEMLPEPMEKPSAEPRTEIPAEPMEKPSAESTAKPHAQSQKLPWVEAPSTREVPPGEFTKGPVCLEDHDDIEQYAVVLGASRLHMACPQKLYSHFLFP